jgi:gamma-glutamyltranspeptidase/glutathione hydrolase
MFASREPKYTSRRSPLVCANGCISTSQPLASEIGLRILKAGGNAADACVAAVAALNCTEPCMCGIGGDAFCLFYDASTKTVHGLNGSGAAPAALDVATARESGGKDGKPLKATEHMLNAGSVHCVTVPGAAAAWVDASRHFGRKPLAEVLQPAIDLAEGGFPVNTIAAQLWADQVEDLTTRWGGLKKNPGAAALLRPDGSPPKAGEWMRMPELAATFRALADGGSDAFYKGRIAKAIVAALKAHGGVMSEADLGAHATELVEPVSAPFGGHTVHQIPPNGSGLVSLLAMRILDRLSPPPSGRKRHTGHDSSSSPSAAAGAGAQGSAQELHRIVEALRLAFAAGAAHVGDYRERPAELASLLDEVLSDEYTEARAALVRDGAALDEAAAGGAAATRTLAAATSETVYLTAVDGDGNACSFICSNYQGFGSGIVPEGCGFSLQNRGANFVLGPSGHPNALTPRQRPYHTIIPSMVTDSATGDLVASFGVMGGFMQPQGHVQVLLNLLKYRMDPQAALDAPRLCLCPAGGSAHNPSMQLPAARKAKGVVVALEDGVPTSVADALRRWGHAVESPVCGAARSLFGRGQIIAVAYGDCGSGDARSPQRAGAQKGSKRARTEEVRHRVLWAGSDGRADGCAMGW